MNQGKHGINLERIRLRRRSERSAANEDVLEEGGADGKETEEQSGDYEGEDEEEHNYDEDSEGGLKKRGSTRVNQEN